MILGICLKSSRFKVQGSRLYVAGFGFQDEPFSIVNSSKEVPYEGTRRVGSVR